MKSLSESEDLADLADLVNLKKSLKSEEGSIEVVEIMCLCMKNLRYHFLTCYAYSVKEPIGELNLKRTLDEDTGVFSSFFSLLSSSSPLGQTAVSGNSTLRQ